MFLVIFEFYMASQRPQRYLETFLEPVASFSQSMSPYRATPTPFTPKIMTFSPPNHLRPPPIFVGRPELLWVDLPIYSPSNFGDPSRLVRNALVCRHFAHGFLNEFRRVEFCHFPSTNISKQQISGWGIFGFSIFLRTIYFQKTHFGRF